MFNFDNIGAKIKGLAKTCFVVETIAAIFTGIGLMASDDDMILIGLLVIVAGPFVAWVGSWLLYGYGELIERTCEIADNTRGEAKAPNNEKASEPQSYTPSYQSAAYFNPNVDPERLAKLQKLREQNLITEEEFQKAISKEV